jgi:hypothetical protein
VIGTLGVGGLCPGSEDQRVALVVAYFQRASFLAAIRREVPAGPITLPTIVHQAGSEPSSSESPDPILCIVSCADPVFLQ